MYARQRRCVQNLEERGISMARHELMRTKQKDFVRGLDNSDSVSESSVRRRALQWV